MTRKPDAILHVEATRDDIFLSIDGVKIAKRGQPGSPQARTWVSLEPGWQVLDGKNNALVVTYNGNSVRVQ